jgi:two-component system, NarL family, sensor histidine kinase NreB
MSNFRSFSSNLSFPKVPSRRVVFLGGIIFVSMITPAIVVNFRKVWQYSKVQDEYLRRDYTDRVDQVSKMLWSFARISEPGNRAVATVASEISVPESQLDKLLLNLRNSTRSSFSVYINSDRRIRAGSSQFLAPTSATYLKTKLPGHYAGLLPSNFVAGTSSEKNAEQIFEQLYRGKHVYPDLLHPITLVSFTAGQVKEDCQLSNLDVFRKDKATSGYAVFDLQSLECLGIAEQLGKSDVREGLVAVSTAPVLRSGKLQGYMVTGTLINNLYQLGDYFLATLSAHNISIFCRDRVVMTLLSDQNNQRLLSRSADPDVQQLILKEGWYIDKTLTLGGKSYFEAYLPLLDDRNRAVGIISVARGSVLSNYLDTFKTVSWLEVALVLLGTWVLGWPLRKLFITQIQRIEQANQQKEVVLQNLDEGVFGLDTKGKVVLSNAYARKLLKYTQLEGLHFGALVTPEGVEQLTTQMKGSKHSILTNAQGRFVTDFIQSNNDRVICEYSLERSSDDETGLTYLLIVRDITARLEAEYQRQNTAVLEERHRISRDLHDGLASSITALKFQLEAAYRLYHRNSEKAMVHLKKAFGLSVECLIDADRSVFDYRIPDDQPTDLVDRLLRVIDMFNSDQLQAEFQVIDQPVLLPFNLCHGITRIFQEAIKNVARHAQATHVALTLSFAPEQLVLTLEDNGVGFNVEETLRKKPKSGLSSMRARVQAIGSTLEILSASGKGTTITVTVKTPKEVCHEQHNEPDPALDR